MDREKVIEAFADYEPYSHDMPCVTIKSKVYRDALALLKEQEAVEPRWIRDIIYPAGAFACGACGERIVEKGIDFYCPKCGRAVKWE